MLFEVPSRRVPDVDLAWADPKMQTYRIRRFFFSRKLQHDEYARRYYDGGSRFPRDKRCYLSG